MDPGALVGDYLSRLEAVAASLPADRRAELVGEVREHIEIALVEAGRSDEATVRNVLGRLGTPEEIVAAEVGQVAPETTHAQGAPPLGDGARRPLSVEGRALLLLTLGSLVLPFIGPVLGLWFVSESTRWTLTQKRTAALIILVLLVMPAAVLVPAVAGGEINWVFGSGSFLLPFVPLAGIVAAVYLVASASLVLTVTRRGQGGVGPG